MWAVTDFTELNGTTRVIPGRSAVGRQELRPAYEEEVAGRDAEGLGVLCVSGSVYHGGGTRIARVSKGSASTWATRSRGCELENRYLACPPEVSPQDRARSSAKLIGNSLGSSSVHTSIGDLQDPMEAVHGPHDRGFNT